MSITFRSRVRRIAVGAFASGIALTGLLAVAPAAQASKGGSCAAFSVTIGATTYKGDRNVTLASNQVAGKTAVVKGTFIEYSVKLDTFQVTSYTLTGAPSDKDITGGVRTVVFASKAPQLSTKLTGSLTLELKSESITLKRGTAQNMKITSKDCAQGGIFQMEPEPGVNYVHKLAPGFTYYTDDLGRTLFTNGTVIGRESPELATLVSRTDTSSTWSVPAGGRMGAVFGEDATEA